MLLTTWNVNSIRTRIELLERFIKNYSPSVIMLQEVKCQTNDYPKEIIKSWHYNHYSVLQKSYNGVSILCSNQAQIICDQLPNLSDSQARYIEVEIKGTYYINVYIPNGNPVNSDKYQYKLLWLQALYGRLKQLVEQSINFVIAGDFNIIPYENDAYNPNHFKDDALFQPEVRKMFFKILNLGLVDTIDILADKSRNRFTWWDFRANNFSKNRGARIDHILVSPLLADKLIKSSIDLDYRSAIKPSDHTPVSVELDYKI